MEFRSKASARQLRALKNYCEKGYRPMLSSHPIYYFESKSNGNQERHHIDELLAQYDVDRKQAARERRLNRK